MAPFRFNFKGKVNTLAGHTKNLKAARNSAKARVEAARKIQAAYRAALERRRKRANLNNITLANRLRSIKTEKAVRNEAARKIQARVRGMRNRKKVAAAKKATKYLSPLTGKPKEEIYQVTNAMGIPTRVTENEYNNNGLWIRGISVSKTDTQLLQEIKKRAEQWGVSLTRVVNGKRVAKTNAQLFRNIKIKNKSEHENLAKRLANLQNKITTHDKYNSRFVKGLREDAWKYEKLKVSMWNDIRSYFAKRGIRYPGVEHLYKTFHGSHGVILTHNKPLDFFLHYYDSDEL